MTYPVKLIVRFLSLVKDRQTAAAGLTLLTILLSVVVVQAVHVGQAVGPWIQETISRPNRFLSAPIQ